MKFFSFYLILFMLSNSNPSSKALIKEASEDFKPDFSNLFWAQEFDTPLSDKEWNYELGDSGWGNNEWQNYTNSKENAFVEDSKLIIRAKYNKKGLTHGNFTSARLTTQNKVEFKYGKIEARIKLPEGQGVWPAFWMLGANFPKVNWPHCGEIDIMEYLGHETNISHGTVHGNGFSGDKGVTKSNTLPEGQHFNTEFHIFSVEWERDSIKWFVDGKQFHAVTPDTVIGDWSFNQDFFLILNVAIGGNWPGYPDKTTVFPQQMEIDYIRVYR